MSPAVAATNVIGEFEQDVKSVGGVTWGNRVHGGAGDSMLVTVPRGSRAQPGTTTAQRIMQANGIKPGKRPPPLNVTLPPPSAQGATAPAMAGRARAPKLADVIEERRASGCCFGFPFFRPPSVSSSNTRPGPVSDACPVAPTAAVLGTALSNPGLSVSSSGRGAPSVLTTSFRQANQSIKRVPQSARSRAASARSRAASAQSRSDRAAALANWGEVSEQEYEELEDFIDEDEESLLAEQSVMSIREETSSSSTTGPTASAAAPSSQSHLQTPSRATSNAIIAYRELTAGIKGAPKSILKSAKRDVEGMLVVGPGAELAGRSRVVLTEGGDTESHSPLYGGNPLQGAEPYGPSAPPGFAAFSFGPSQNRINVMGHAQLGPEGAGGSACGPEGQVAIAQSGGSGTALAGVTAGGMARTGPSSIKMTAEEVLGLLMARGKLTQDDVTELGFPSTSDRRPSQGYGCGGSPTSHSPARFVPGSACAGGPWAAGEGAGPVIASSQCLGGSQAWLQLQLQGTFPSGSDVSAAAQGPVGLQPPSLAQLRGNDNSSSLQQRVRFGASQTPTAGGGATTGLAIPGAPTQCLISSSSHRVRFGDEDPAQGGGTAGSSCCSSTPITALPVMVTATMSLSGAAATGAAASVLSPGSRLGPNGGPIGLTEILRASSSSVPAAEDSEGNRPHPLVQRPVHGVRRCPSHSGRRTVALPDLGDGSLDLDEVLESTALQLDGGRKATQPELAVAAGAGTGTATLPSCGRRACTRPDGEALRLSTPSDSFAAQVSDGGGGSGITATPYRPQHLRSSDSGVMRGMLGGAGISLGFRGASASAVPPTIGGSVDGVGGGRPVRLTSSAQPDPSRPANTLRLPEPDAAATTLGPSLLGLSEMSRPVSAGSNNNNVVLPYAPPALNEAVSGTDAELESASCPLAAMGSAGKSGASLLGSGGGRMGAVDQLALRKLQSHMNRSNASRCSGEPSTSAPLRQASRSNWIHGNDDERNSGPGILDRDGGYAGAGLRQPSLLMHPSVGRSVRFPAPMMCEQSDGQNKLDDEDDNERVAVAAAARCRASRHNMLCDGVYNTAVSGPVQSYRGDRSGGWM